MMRDQADREEYQVLRSVVSSTDIAQLKSLHEQAVLKIAESEGVIPSEVSRLTSAWTSEHPPISACLKFLAPKIKEALVENQCRNASDFSDLSGATMFVLSEGQESATHAHQDLAYRGGLSLDSRYAYTTWIAFDRCDEKTGALTFSENMASIPVGPREDFLRARRVDPSTTERWLSGQSVVCVNAGDAIVFDSTQWHASTPFCADGQRVALAVRWRSKSGWERDVHIESSSSSPDVFGMDTSGQLLGKAIESACRSKSIFSDTTDALHSLMHIHVAVFDRLSVSASSALKDLANGLMLQEKHHARVSANVWCRVRDISIPELTTLAGET